MNPFQDITAHLQTWHKVSSSPLLVVTGPTASGKTKLAVQLAQKFNGEVINADSRQIYQEIVIGNALTSAEEMQGVPHHLFSFVPLSQTLSVAEYKQLADEKVREIQARGKLPILCGGSTMWTDAVAENYTIPEVAANQELRDELHQLSVDELLERLRTVDPDSYEQLKTDRNPRYLVRALEVYHATGKPKSQLAQKGERQYEVFKIAPEWDREVLYERINQRTKQQLDSGLVEEVQAIIDRHASGSPQALLELGWASITSIGCKEVVPHLMGDISREELLARLQQANRNYAKRQLTWLRKDEEIHWVKPS